MVNQAYMAGPVGRTCPLGQTLYGVPTRDCEGAPEKSSRPRLEQGVGGGSLSGNLVAVQLDPHDFVFQQRDPFGQLIVREPIERFQRQLAGGVTAQTGAVVFIHPLDKIGLPALAVNTP